MKIWQWFVVSVMFFIVTPAIALHQSLALDCERHHCAAVVDAGSSGSRIYWYRYTLDKDHNPIHIKEIYSKKITPGLGTIAQDSSTIFAYLDQLMRDFSQPNVPVFIYATAGMRLLPLDTQAQYYAAIRDWFALHPEWPLHDLRTISGNEEGVYGWLSLNYHLNSLQDKRQPLVGLIEVGGASAQIAFPVIDPIPNNQDYIDLTLYGRRIHLFSHSFLGLGINELFAHSQNFPVCFAIDFPLSNGGRGLGDAEQCRAQIAPVLQQRYHVDQITRPALGGSSATAWYTVSALSAMISNQPFDFSDSRFTGTSLVQQANRHFCQQSYKNLVENYPGNEYVQKNCLLAGYFSGLLEEGLGFEADKDIHYLANYEGTWTLGVLMTIATGQYPKFE